MSTAKPPLRIASLLSAATEILYALGLGDQVVGVSHECDYPPGVERKPRLTFSHIDSAAESGQIDEQVRQRVARGEPLYGVDEAALAQLRPDLIVTQAQCDVCAVRYEDVLATVRRIDPTGTINVVSLNPASLADVVADVARIGYAAGAGDAARQLVGRLDARINAVRQATTPLAPHERPRVVLIEWTEPLMVAGNWTPELAEIAGGEYTLARAGSHSGYVDWETIRRYDPQLIVVSACGFDLPRTIREAARLHQLPGWSDLSAVRAGRVWAADGNAYFNRPGPRLVDSLELLGHLTHPERVPSPRVAGSLGWQRIE
ncbi:MAG: cobalamin-binding protein [Planctomycetia bacterium]|nr:cobalamin-binding protein [Planctomycetia bacterium]